MKVLQVIHGYPPFYMAGSEVYTYNLVKELSKRAEVAVFSRIEDPFEPSYSMNDEKKDGVQIYRINKPQRDYCLEDKYIDKKMEKAFFDVLSRFDPDIVHFGHLSHLSTNLPGIVKDEFNVPIVFTLHDYWLGCFRGQLINHKGEICPGPSIDECMQCAQSTFKDHVTVKDIERMLDHLMVVRDKVDLFLSPSEAVSRFIRSLGVPESKIVSSKYGFDRTAITYRRKTYTKDSKLTFGYTGRIIPVKGVALLLEAFKRFEGRGHRLLVFGDDSSVRPYLKRRASSDTHLMGSYDNQSIDCILDRIDVLVVPSIWLENSPLVIQEAFLKGVPVITSDLGGMAELVKHGVNGLLFSPGDVRSLSDTLKMVMDDPTLLNRLIIDPHTVRDGVEEAGSMIGLYNKLLGGGTTD